MSLNFGAITTGVQTVTATGPVAPTAGLSVATAPATTSDFTVFCEVQSLTDGAHARIVIEESANAFTSTSPILVYDVVGAVSSAADLVQSVRKYQVPATVAGTSGAVMRANVETLTAAASLLLRAWIEY